jgi:hypothetical protein
MVVPTVAGAVIVLAVGLLSSIKMSNDALEEASVAVCPHLEPPLVSRIESHLTASDLHVRGARVLQFTANRSYWFVVADLQGRGHEGDGDIGVWLIDASNSDRQDPLAPIDAVNALASSVSDFADKPMGAATLERLDDCIREVQREAAGM